MLHDPAFPALARRPICRPAHRSAWTRVAHALLDLAGRQAVLLRHGERPWASATFTGARHTVALEFTGAAGVAAGEAYIAAVPDHEFALPHCLVADAAVTHVEQTTDACPRLVVEVDLLLLDED